MNDLTKKKWSSFDEMYNDLKNTDYYKNSTKKSITENISNLVKEIELAQSSKDFFNCTCKLSSFFDELDQDFIHDIYKKTNVYVLVLNATLRNGKFVKTLLNVASKNKKIINLKKEKFEFEQLILLNTALRLAFFGIAIDHKSINETSIEFLRKNVTDILKLILKQKNTLNIDFINLCFFLEKVVWDNELYFNQNYEARFPVKLKDSSLFENLMSSRSFAGITFTSLVIKPATEDLFKKIISKFNNEKFNISLVLDSIFNLANDLNEKINHYYRTTPKDISNFFDIFIKGNEKNLIYCLKNFCSGFHFQGEKKFFNIISDKLNTISSLKQDFINYTKENFRAFNNKIGDKGDEWTNKLFLISIKTISILDEIKNAQDLKWVVSVAVHEFRLWLLEIHEVLNKYYIEDDWEKIRDCVIQENERIEWKSSFYIPIEQEYRDEMSDAGISKKLFEKILKAILGMLNTDGGILIVGVVENPDAVKRPEIKEFLIKKNGLTFFDINYELKKYSKTLDHVRLQILENLKQITDSSPDKFNDLIEFEPIVLRDDLRVVSVIKILIKKAEKLFFNVKKEGNLVLISLTKRAQGQNVDVDVRDYI